MQIIVSSNRGWPSKLSHVTSCPQARMFTHVVHNSGLSNSANRKIILQVGQIIWIWIAMLTSTWLKIDNNIDWILKKSCFLLEFSYEYHSKLSCCSSPLSKKSQWWRAVSGSKPCRCHAEPFLLPCCLASKLSLEMHDNCKADLVGDVQDPGITACIKIILS